MLAGMLKKIIATAVLAVLVLAGIVLAAHKSDHTKPAENKLSVVASYYPLYDFVKNVGGGKAAVTNMTPAGTEPHDFEPSAKALADAHKARVFVYNGGSLEPWVSGFLSDYKNVKIKASDTIPLQTITDEQSKSKQAQDPHFWLDPVLAKQIIDNIRDGLSIADPANASVYAQNAEDYKARLDRLANAYQQGLASCQLHTIVTSHAAFGYLARRYNIDVQSIAGISPEEEPSAAKLAELSTLVKTKGIKYVFFESLVPTKLADTIAAETGAKTIVFDPIEGLSNEQQKQGKNYITIQEQNIANLKTALACQ
jgi:zinc transport system substrate-binding protein